MNYEAGSRLGDYEILQVLGAGGMGRVYKVRNVISDRVEAMKVLLPDLEGDPDFANRFMREIKVQASLDHPNIAALYTALRIDNQLVMLMEYVEGVTLGSVMESGPIPIDQAVGYMVQTLAALSYAHGRGVVHRDLKPTNIMIMPNGTVKLMDFGIAKVAADRKLTQTGRAVGSLYYMSPEQINGGQDVDARSDLYSLGVSLYEIVTGARPFQGDSEYSIMAAHLQGNPRPPIQISPNLPPALSEIILMALEKDPAKRFQTADAFEFALLSVGKSSQMAAPPPSPVMGAVQAAAEAPAPAVGPPPPQPPRGHRGLWIAVGSLATIAALVVLATQIPKFRHVTADGTSRPPQTTPAVPAPPPVVTTPVTPAPAETPVVVQQPTPPLGSPTVRPPVTAQVQRRPVPPASSQSTSQQPAAPSPAAPPPIAPSPAPAVQPAPVVDPAKSDAAVKEVREQLTLLGVRADTVRTSLDNLRRQQASTGLGLRSDMASAAQRMEYYLSETDAAVRSGDSQAAKRNLDLAEREVAKLENFLGK